MKPRRHLFFKYVTLILALVGGALAVSGGIGVYFSYQETHKSLLELEQEKALAAASRIEQFVKEIEHQIGWTALPQVAERGNPVELRRFDFVKLLRQVPAITEAAYIDSAGREQVRVSRLAMDMLGSKEDRSADPRFLDAKSGRTYFGPVYFRKGTEPYMSIALRVGRDGGVTAVEVNLKFIWDVITQIRVGRTGFAYVVNRDGSLVAHPDISLVLQKTDLSALPPVKAALAEGGPDSGDRASGEARDRTGQPVLTAHARIETLGWAVFVEQPQSEAYEPMYASLLRNAVVLLAALLLSGLASLALARRMVQPIRILEEGARRIGAGQLDQNIDIRTGDELQGLADQFNRMSLQLKESYAGLERKVDERTRELRDTLEQQTATAGILRVISESPTDVQPVLDAVAERAAWLCDAASAAIYLVEGEVLRQVVVKGNAPGELPSVETLSIDRGATSGRALLERRTVHVHDAMKEREEYPLSHDYAVKLGHHTMVAAPLLREGQPFGVILLRRLEVRDFTDVQIALLRTFSDQAAIAIDNVRLFREIREKSAQLETANKHKSEFLANMSHELRTPLNAIIGFSEVLIERMFGELNEKQADYLSDIHTSGKHLLSLINDILDLSKVEAGRMELEISEFDLPAALQNALTLVRERAQRHGLKLEVEVEPGLGMFHADERKFKQIMVNLLSNAVKFTPEGGRVSVRARLNGPVAEVSVSDTGVGIAPEDQTLVFEEFRQAGKDYTRKAEGTGLGLALTRRLVALHGGEIRLESAPGQGSTFTFTLPIHHGQ